MDYKKIAKEINELAEFYDYMPGRSKELKEYATAITDLLSRAEAAESAQDTLKSAMAEYKDRAEKAEREMNEYKNIIYEERPCAFCAGYTGEWNKECFGCDRCTTEYRPKFRLQIKKEK